ncbi:MAG: hypothetical protein Q7R80_02620 [bacterium]|nr:hypothetical protein [bacterium]
MLLLEIVESALPAVPLIAAAIVGAIILAVVLASASWVAMFVWVEVLDRDVDWNLEPAGGWDFDELEEEVSDG